MQKALENQPTNQGHKAITSRQGALSHNVSDFVTSKSLDIFKQYGMNTDWLNRNSPCWKKDENYKKAKNVFQNLIVVNDCAERGVKVIQDYSGFLTKDEKQLQGVIQTVHSHRTEFMMLKFLVDQMLFQTSCKNFNNKKKRRLNCQKSDSI